MKRSKYFTVDFQEQTIIGSKSAIEKARRIGSPQYKELCEVIKAHPNFKITEKAIKTKKDILFFRTATSSAGNTFSTACLIL